jgi:Zn-dependent protease with chaperone function
MHLAMILSAIVIAWVIRQIAGLVWFNRDLQSDHQNTQLSASYDQRQNMVTKWQQRWQRSLFLLVFPALLILTTAVAVLLMGPQGQMVGLPASEVGFAIAACICGYLVVIGIKLLIEIVTATNQLADYELIELDGKQARVLPVLTIFAAQVGLWQPELVVSRGMLKDFARDRLQAVLAHEQAHYHYRDTFWFFWLGWLRQATLWLPHSQALWQELMLLRELRADRWAAQRVDNLLLAESILLSVASAVQPDQGLTGNMAYGIGLSQFDRGDRLEERIDALLSNPAPITNTKPWHLSWLIAVLLPFLSLPLHLQ